MSYAFKEWTLICSALAAGTQSIIIRKGGIAEGREGFRFKHADFLLFPTLFHEQVSKLRLPADTPLPAPAPDGHHEIKLAAHVEWTVDVKDWATVQALAPYHLWAEPEMDKRFRQDDEPGVSVAFVRVSHLSPAHTFPDAPQYGGCRSWIEVPEPPAGTSEMMVLDEATHRTREAAIKSVLGLA